MGLAVYRIPATRAIEWPKILVRAGCHVDVTEEVSPGWQILRENPQPCVWRNIDIGRHDAQILLKLETSSAVEWGCIIIPASGAFVGDLSICLATQIVSAGGTLLFERDLLQGISVWRGTTSLSSATFLSSLSSLKGLDGNKIQFELKWSSISNLSGSPCTTAFESLQLNCFLGSVRIWFGPTLDNGAFVAYRFKGSILATRRLRKLNVAIQLAVQELVATQVL